MLPSGDHGPGCIGNDTAAAVAEEWHVIPLNSTPGYFAVFRTNQGLLGASWTADPTGATGWVKSTYASFDIPPLPGRPAIVGCSEIIESGCAVGKYAKWHPRLALGHSVAKESTRTDNSQAV